MKNIFFVTVFFMSFSARAQWIQLSLGTQGNAPYLTVFDLSFINDSVGFAADGENLGGLGAIYKTIDGGYNWELVLDTDCSINDIEFISNDTGYAVGSKGRIYRTTDTGDSWQLLNTLTPWWDLKCIYFKNNHESYIGSSKDFCPSCTSVLLKSIDGWQTFEEVPPPIGGYQPSNPLNTIFKIYFCDSLHGYCTSNYLLRTNNGGNTWFFEDSIKADATYYDFTSNNGKLYAAGAGLGLNVTQGALIKLSSDDGDNWHQLPAPQFGMDTTAFIRGIAFVSNSVGYATGGPQNISNFANILITTDGGTNWQEDLFPDSLLQAIGCYTFFHVMCPTNKVCYTGGIGGVIMKKENADLGTSIKSISANHNSQLVLYPNPVISTATIEYQTNNAGKASVTVENTLGQVLQQLQIENNKKKQVDMSALAAGIYFIKFFDGREQVVVKVVKN